MEPIEALMGVQCSLLSRVVQAQRMELQISAKLLLLRCLGCALLLRRLGFAFLSPGSLQARPTICSLSQTVIEGCNRQSAGIRLGRAH